MLAARALQYASSVTLLCSGYDATDLFQPSKRTVFVDILSRGACMTGKSRRGFASMDPERQKEIASKGGRAAHEKGTAHEWSSVEARNAGRKGGVTVSQDRAHMAAIGREGGESRSAAARQSRVSDREVPMVVSRDGMSEGLLATSRSAVRARSDDLRVDD